MKDIINLLGFTYTYELKIQGECVTFLHDKSAPPHMRVKTTKDFVYFNLIIFWRETAFQT